jgi:hypothetical protein
MLLRLDSIQDFPGFFEYTPEALGLRLLFCSHRARCTGSNETVLLYSLCCDYAKPGMSYDGCDGGGTTHWFPGIAMIFFLAARPADWFWYSTS